LSAWKGTTMTRLFLDQQEIRPLPGNLLSLEAILKHVEDTHLESDTVIRQVHVDGRPLLFNEIDPEAAAMAEPRLATATVEIFTGKLSTIARESVNEAANYIARIETAIPSLAMSLRADPGTQAFEALKQFCDGFLWLNLLLFRLDTGDGHEKGEFDPGSGDDSARKMFVSILKELVQAQERKDFVLVADVLEYEILALLPGYRQQFLDLMPRLENRPPE